MNVFVAWTDVTQHRMCTRMCEMRTVEVSEASDDVRKQRWMHLLVIKPPLLSTTGAERPFLQYHLTCSWIEQWFLRDMNNTANVWLCPPTRYRVPYIHLSWCCISHTRRSVSFWEGLFFVQTVDVAGHDGWQSHPHQLKLYSSTPVPRWHRRATCLQPQNYQKQYDAFPSHFGPHNSTVHLWNTFSVSISHTTLYLFSLSNASIRGTKLFLNVHVIYFVQLCTYIIPNEKSVILIEVTVPFTWSPVMSPLPPPVTITSEETHETAEGTPESEEGSQRTWQDVTWLKHEYMI